MHDRSNIVRFHEVLTPRPRRAPPVSIDPVYASNLAKWDTLTPKNRESKAINLIPESY